MQNPKSYEGLSVEGTMMKMDYRVEKGRYYSNYFTPSDFARHTYHVITVSFDRYDETGETTYTTGKGQAEKLAVYIQNHLNGRVDLVCAESLESIPAVFLTQFDDMEIGGVILSGAEYMNYGIFNKLAIDLFAPMTYKLMT